MNVRTLRGTNDILPAEIKKWQFIEEVARKTFRLYGYEELRTPIIEETALFTRTIGETTDIVEKQMYTFQDQAKRKISLRPEATASVARAYLEHAFDKKRKFAKFYYIGPMFRSERPQKGRMRQFHQIGVEAIGSYDPCLDAEIMSLAINLLKKIGIAQPNLAINTLGCRKDKKKIAKELRENLKAQFSELCKSCQQRFSRNVFRVLDCKNENCRKITHKLPSLHQSLCPACSEHFKEVKKALDILDVKYSVDDYLVRGLDYYTKTAFEITHKALGSQDALGAGGRYDNLVSDMDGEETGAIGFALGVERLIIALSDHESKETTDSSIDLYIATKEEKAHEESFKMADLLRREGIATEIDYLNRSLKSQMRAADKNGVKFVAISGEPENNREKIILKDMGTGQQEEIDKNDFVKEMKRKLQDYEAHA